MKRRLRRLRLRLATVIQRARYGIGTEDTFSVSHHVAGVIARGVEELRRRELGHPTGMSADDWDFILSSIRMSFSGYHDDLYEDGAANPGFRVGMDLFVKHFDDLWD